LCCVVFILEKSHLIRKEEGYKGEGRHLKKGERRLINESKEPSLDGKKSYYEGERSFRRKLYSYSQS